MSDVIGRLLEVEKEARQIIADAEQKAGAVLSRANDEARAAKAEARTEGRRQADQFIKQKTEELRQRYQEQVERARAKLPAPGSLKPDEVRQAVRFAVDVISGTESGRQG